GTVRDVYERDRSEGGEVSKRPEGESTVPSRTRRPFPRLNDLRIRSKLGLILVVPIIAIVSVAAISVASDVQKASDAVRSHSLATLSADAANLVHQLQSERGVAATYLSESAPEAQSGIPEAAKATDAARE